MLWWLVLNAAIEIGWDVSGGYRAYDFVEFTEYEEVDGIYSEIDAEAALFGIGIVGGTIRVNMVKPLDGRITFFPHTLLSELNIGVRIGIAEIGFRHSCSHPVFPYAERIMPRLTEIRDTSVSTLYLRIGE